MQDARVGAGESYPVSLDATGRRWSAALFWVVLAAVSFAPVTEGVFPVFPGAIVMAGVFLFAGYVLGSRAIPMRMKGIAVAVLSIGFTITVLDLSMRLVRWCGSGNQGAPRLEVCRAMPWLVRYSKNMRWEGDFCGDLAGMSGKKAWEEPRRVRIVTDRFGFRNELTDTGRASPRFDLVVLGDSFGDGSHTSQECIWSTVLARDYGVKVYNLSIAASGPWQEFMNLSLEDERLNLERGTIVLWAIFPANDLDDEYHPVYDKKLLPWRGPVGRFLGGYKSFRHRSPLRQISFGAVSDPVVAKTFLNGRKLLFLDRYERNRKRSAPDIRRHPSYPSLKATFDAMVKLTQAKGWRLMVVAVPSKEEVYAWVLDQAPAWTSGAEPSGFSQVLNDLCRQSGIPFLDLKPKFVTESRRLFEESGELLWWYDDTHWNNRGHQLAATLVHDELLTQVERSHDGSHR